MQYETDCQHADFAGARLYFRPEPDLPEIVEFRAAGVRVTAQTAFPFLDGTKAAYVRGPATVVKIFGVFAARLLLTLYDPSGGWGLRRDSSGSFLFSDFRRDRNGSAITKRFEWGEIVRDVPPTAYFQAVLDDPFGFAELEFHATGRCRVTFDTHECVRLEEYYANVEEYLKELHTGGPTRHRHRAERPRP